MTSTTSQMLFETVDLGNNIVYYFLSELEPLNHASPLLRDKRNALKHGFHKPQAFDLNIHFSHTIHSTYVYTFHSVGFTTHRHRN